MRKQDGMLCLSITIEKRRKLSQCETDTEFLDSLEEISSKIDWHRGKNGN